jgi:hypothetical protein
VRELYNALVAVAAVVVLIVARNVVGVYQHPILVAVNTTVLNYDMQHDELRRNANKLHCSSANVQANVHH